jgi:hypothetical protein
MILKPLWNVLEANYHIVDNQHQSTAEQSLDILSNICISISRLLEGPHQSVMKKQLSQIGLHPKLSKMINSSSNFKFENHRSLLKLINLFNAIDVVEVRNEYNLLGGISIVTTKEEHKSKQA